MSAPAIAAPAAVLTDVQLAHWLPIAFMVAGVVLLLWFAWRDRGVPWIMDEEVAERRSSAPGRDGRRA